MFAQTTSGAEHVSLSANPAASVKISAGNDGPLLMTRTLVLAAPFATLADSVKIEDLKHFWAGDAGALAGATNNGITPTLFLDPDSRAALSLLLGPPAADARLLMLAPGELLSKTWEAHWACHCAV